MSKDKASTGALESLHNSLAEKLSELLEVVDGETKGAAAILNVARQFLKDNGIDSPGGEGSPLAALAKETTKYPFDPVADSRTH